MIFMKNKKILTDLIYDELYEIDDVTKILEIKNEMIYEILVQADLILKIKGVNLEDDIRY